LYGLSFVAREAEDGVPVAQAMAEFRNRIARVPQAWT
jgi:hypothetical protein